MSNNGLLQHRWFIPFAACLGIMVGLPSVLILSFAVFLKPVPTTLGWTRGEMSSAPLVTIWITLLAQPLLGQLVDRFRFRRVMVPVTAALLTVLGPYTYPQERRAAVASVAAAE